MDNIGRVGGAQEEGRGKEGKEGGFLGFSFYFCPFLQKHAHKGEKVQISANILHS